MTDTVDTVEHSENTVGGNTKTPTVTRNRQWFMTWNSFPENWRQLLTQQTDEWVGQVEEGESGNKHIQACFRWKNARSFDQVKLLFPGAHIEPCKNWSKSTEYCTKERSRVGPRDYFRSCNIVMAAWQAKITKMLSEEEPDLRAIHWIWSTRGGYGKTTFCRHLALAHGAQVVNGTGRDVFHALKEHQPRVVCFDLSRDGTIDYSVLESVKNGMFFSGKYESGMCIFDIPHVLVFANYAPNVAKLSADRWRIVHLDSADD